MDIGQTIREEWGLVYAGTIHSYNSRDLPALEDRDPPTSTPQEAYIKASSHHSRDVTKRGAENMQPLVHAVPSITNRTQKRENTAHKKLAVALNTNVSQFPSPQEDTTTSLLVSNSLIVIPTFLKL